LNAIFRLFHPTRDGVTTCPPKVLFGDIFWSFLGLRKYRSK